MGTELSSAFPAATGHICADCEAEIVYMEEAFLLRVVQPQVVAGAVMFHDIIDEDDVEGGFLYEPFFYCFSCWENHIEELRKEAKDQPPIVDPASELECVCCGSGIRSWEYAGAFTLGEFHISPRQPNHEVGPLFQPTSKHELLCLYCLSIFNDNYVVMWDDLSQQGECADCILSRCWRHPNMDCSCGCHSDYDFDIATSDILDDNDDQRF